MILRRYNLLFLTVKLKQSALHGQTNKTFTGTKRNGDVIWKHDGIVDDKPDLKYNLALVSLNFIVGCS